MVEIPKLVQQGRPLSACPMGKGSVMIILLLIAQVILVILQYAAGLITLSPWVIFLPLIVIFVLWLVALGIGSILIIDSFTRLYAPKSRPRRFR